MNKQEKMDEIDRKCRVAGCNEKEAKIHLKLYFENWDVHPPQEFIGWLHKFHPQAENHVSAWNSDPCRQEYYGWIEIGQPDPPPTPPFDMAEAMASFRASMAKIESRFSRGSGGPVFEDKRLKGYDKR